MFEFWKNRENFLKQFIWSYFLTLKVFIFCYIFYLLTRLGLVQPLNKSLRWFYDISVHGHTLNELLDNIMLEECILYVTQDKYIIENIIAPIFVSYLSIIFWSENSYLNMLHYFISYVIFYSLLHRHRWNVMNINRCLNLTQLSGLCFFNYALILGHMHHTFL